MNARAIIYNLMIIGAMLLAGCSHDDVTIEITPSEPVAISFMPTLSPTLAEGEEMTRAGQPGVMNSEDLRTTGFGVFASLNENKTPDMMFNQEVKFTFVGDIDKPANDPQIGYHECYRFCCDRPGACRPKPGGRGNAFYRIQVLTLAPDPSLIRFLPRLSDQN